MQPRQNLKYLFLMALLCHSHFLHAQEDGDEMVNYTEHKAVFDNKYSTAYKIDIDRQLKITAPQHNMVKSPTPIQGNCAPNSYVLVSAKVVYYSAGSNNAKVIPLKQVCTHDKNKSGTWSVAPVFYTIDRDAREPRLDIRVSAYVYDPRQAANLKSNSRTDYRISQCRLEPPVFTVPGDNTSSEPPPRKKTKYEITGDSIRKKQLKLKPQKSVPIRSNKKG